MHIEIRNLERRDRAWAKEFLEEQAGAARIVSRGRLHQADRLPGYLAAEAGRRVGLLTYEIRGEELEVVSLYTSLRRHGVGSRLLEAALGKAMRERCKRLWLITTNDNQPAIAFYESRGMALVAVHRGAVARSRNVKPEIPRVGYDGIPIEDEFEFEIRLHGNA